MTKAHDIDPWDLAQKPGYHEEEFYNRSTDGHGHSEQIMVKLSPGVFGQIGSIVAQKEFAAYRQPADIIRDAIIHRLHYLGDLMKNRLVQQTVDLNIILSKIDVLARARQEQEAVVVRFKDECERAVDNCDLEQLTMLLMLGQDSVEGLRSLFLDQMTDLISRFSKSHAHMQAAADAKFAQEVRELDGGNDES